MSKEKVRTTVAPAPGGAYSQGIRAGDFVYIAGQGPNDPATGSVVGATIEDQTERTIENIAAILHIRSWCESRRRGEGVKVLGQVLERTVIAGGGVRFILDVWTEDSTGVKLTDGDAAIEVASAS